MKSLLIGFFLVATGAVASPAAAQPATGTDVWAELRFLLGTWDTTSTGQPGEGKGRREYRLALRDRFIEVRNTVTYPPQPKNPKGETHEDVGFFSYDRSRKSFVLRQFHIEGFVNTYVSDDLDSQQGIVFNTEAIENIPNGWRARETYRVINDNEIEEVFELAEPGKEFTVYSRIRMTRRR